MTGKTHLAVGMAAALCVTQPDSVKELVLCLGGAALGSVISDVDVKASDSRQKLNKIIVFTAFFLGMVAWMEYRWHIGIVKNFVQDSNAYRLGGGFLAFLLVCIFGKYQPHRSFMHSLLASAILGAILYVMYPDIVVYFWIGMLSHILLDMLNFKKVRIFYPAKKGKSFNICHSDGFISTVLFLLGTTVTIYMSWQFLWAMV